MSKKIVTAVSLTHANFGEVRHEWSILIAAATQDYQSREIGVRPNGDRDLAEAYRAILRGCLPLISASLAAAYNEYCSTSLTTHTQSGVHAAGHGSWVTGPDGDLQKKWYDWKSLEERIAKAAKQPV